jgi:hypothetical protein
MSRYPLENARFQWEDGWRAYEALADDGASRRQADRVISAIHEELRQRIGVTFTSAELADLYSRGTDWCLQVAVETSPALIGEAQALADAAFWIFLRRAGDFAGGRLAL